VNRIVDLVDHKKHEIKNKNAKFALVINSNCQLVTADTIVQKIDFFKL